MEAQPLEARPASSWSNDTPINTGIRVHGQRWMTGDVDGDGRSDYIGTTVDEQAGVNPGFYFINIHTAMPNQEGIRVVRESGTGRFNYRFNSQNTGIYWNHNPRMHFYRPLVGDVNADGRSDVVLLSQAPDSRERRIYVGLSRGDGQFKILPVQRDGVWNPRDRWFLADATGDGRADLMLATPHPGCDHQVAAASGCEIGRAFEHASLQVAVAKENGRFEFAAPSDTDWTFKAEDEAHWFVADADGDGRADFQRVVNIAAHPQIPYPHAGVQTAFAEGDGRFRILGPRPPNCEGVSAVRPWCASGLHEVSEPWTSWPSPLPWTDQHQGSDLVHQGDFDGDGLGDIVLAKFESSSRNSLVLISALSTGDGRYESLRRTVMLAPQHLNFWWKSVRRLDHVPNRWITGDWNGDRITDIIVVSPNNFEADPAQWPRMQTRLTRLLFNARGESRVDQPPPLPFYYDCWERRPEDNDPSGPQRCPNDLSFSSFLGDVDGDGQSDFMYAGARFNEALRRTHFDVQLSSPAMEGRTNWRSADADGDGYEDLVRPEQTSDGVIINSIMRGPGSAPVAHRQRVMPFMFNSISKNWMVADVGSTRGGPDGRADLVYLHHSDTTATLRVYTLLGEGDGRWTYRFRQIDSGSSTRDDITAWRIGDYDGDGDSDLIHIAPDSDPGGVGGPKLSVLTSDGDGFWRPAHSEALTNFGGPDTTAWRTADLNGDGRVDLVHVRGGGDQLVISSLISSDGNGWLRHVQSGLSSAATSATRSWHAVDTNADSRADLVQVDSRDGVLNVVPLISIGSGEFVSQQSSGPTLIRSSDSRRWKLADANGDGTTDLVRLAPSASGLEVATLFARSDGTYARSMYSYTPYGGAALGRDILNWQMADADGDGRRDIVRVSPAPSGVGMWTLRANSPREYLASVDNGLGRVTRLQYGSSSAFETRASSAGDQRCHLPAGVVLQLPARQVEYLQGREVEARTQGYRCARWSYRDRRLLGWGETATGVAPVGHSTASSVTIEQNTVDEQCLSRPVGRRLEDAGGRVLSIVQTTYEPLGAGPTSRCREQSIRTNQLNGGTNELVSEVGLKYDEFGNTVEIADLGDPRNSDDDKVTRRTYRPELSGWLLSYPASESISDSVGSGGRLFRVTRWCYDGNNGVADEECEGKPTTGRMTAEKVLNSDGRYRTTTYAHDDVGNVIRAVDARGNESTIEYDTTRRTFPTRICNAMRHCSTLSWDIDRGQLLRETDVNGVASEWRYDEFGRQSSSSRVGSTTSRFYYLDWADPQLRRVKRVVDDGTPDGLWSETYLNGYDRAWKRVREGRGPGVTETQFTDYVGSSARQARVSRWGFSSQPAVFENYSYDAAGRLLQVENSDGTRQNWGYWNDDRRVVTQETDERGSVRSVSHDSRGRLVAASEAADLTGMPSTIEYSYDAADQLRAYTDAEGNETTQSFDLVGNLLERDDPDLGRWAWQWDDAGNVTTQTDARGVRTDYSYDALNRLQSKKAGDGPVSIWHYDEPGHGLSVGRLTSISDSSGAGCPGTRSQSWGYDEAGNVNAEEFCVLGERYEVRLAYDAVGRQLSVTYPDGETVSSQYGNDGRLSAIPGLFNEIVYDPNSNPTRILHANGVQSEWTWSQSRGWLDNSRVTRQGTGEVLQGFSYEHEADGLIKRTEREPNEEAQSFSYDGLDRLTGVQGERTEQYEWDVLGNKLTVPGVGPIVYPEPGAEHCIPRPTRSEGCSRPHAPVQVGPNVHTYDGNGNLLRVERPSDGTAAAENHNQAYVVAYKRSGSPRDTLWSIAQRFLGDARRWPEIFLLNMGQPQPQSPTGRFDNPHWIYPGQRLTLPVGEQAGGGGPHTFYKWNEDNRLIEAQSPEAQVAYRYNASGSQVERRAPGGVTRYFGPWAERTSGGQFRKHYLVGDRRVASRGATGGLEFIHSDYLGSTTMLTDNNGSATGFGAYEAFGLSVPESSLRIDLRFTGVRRDPDLGIDFMGARAYDPSSGIFLSPDSIVPSAGYTQAANRYAYAYGNPMGWTDPSGHDPDCASCDSSDSGQRTSSVDDDGRPIQETVVRESRYRNVPDEEPWPVERYLRDIWEGYESYSSELSRQQDAYDARYEQLYDEENANTPLILKMFPGGVTEDPVRDRVERRIGSRPKHFALELLEALVLYRGARGALVGAPSVAAAGLPRNATVGPRSAVTPRVTEQMVRDAMKDAPLQSQQGAVSLPKIQRAVDQLASGSPAPPIRVDGSIIVDGNHRYVAGRILGQEPSIQPWIGGRQERIVPWANQRIDPVDWGD